MHDNFGAVLMTTTVLRVDLTRLAAIAHHRQLRTRQSANEPEQYHNYTRQGAQQGGPPVCFCNFLEDHGVSPSKVLRNAGLDHADWDDPASVKAFYAASTKYWHRTVCSGTDASAAGITWRKRS